MNSRLNSDNICFTIFITYLSKTRLYSETTHKLFCFFFYTTNKQVHICIHLSTQLFINDTQLRIIYTDVVSVTLYASDQV